MDSAKYQIKHEQDKLVFTTSNYRAEKTSVLHSGVYTKEFTSMLFASATCIAASMFTGFIGAGSRIIRYVILVIIFAVFFLISRKYIFKDKYLEVGFDKSGKTVTIIMHGIITKKLEKIPFDKLKSVDIGHKKFVPENPDGIDFVQKISAQHGSAVPELSEEEEFITLSLRLTDGSERVIFAAKMESGKVNGEPEIPVREIRDFMANHV